VFAKENSPTIEYQDQTITLWPGDYKEYDDMILYTIFINSITSKIIAEGRIFAIDSFGQIISDNIASDKVSVKWE